MWARRAAGLCARGPWCVAKGSDRLPGEVPVGGDVEITWWVGRGPGGVLGLTSGRGLFVQNGLARSAQLPMFLRGARVFAKLGDEALWATATGLYHGMATRWVRLDAAAGAVTGAVELAPVTVTGVRAAWCLVGDRLRRARVSEGAVL